MSTRKSAFLSALFVASCAIAVTAPTFAQTTAPECAKMKALDPDNDGTMDLDEARKAASALFDRLDHDKDGTLDHKELSGRMTAKELQAADRDHDGTIDKREFIKVVEARFKAANPDKDGTIDCGELGTPAGKSLLRVLEK
jgi:Ca2+-binding EF-hand superfamily protein